MTAPRIWLRILSIAVEKELKVLASLNDYYCLVSSDCFPLFLRVLIALIKLILWLKFFRRQKADRGPEGRDHRAMFCLSSSGRTEEISWQPQGSSLERLLDGSFSEARVMEGQKGRSREGMSGACSIWSEATSRHSRYSFLTTDWNPLDSCVLLSFSFFPVAELMLKVSPSVPQSCFSLPPLPPSRFLLQFLWHLAAPSLCFSVSNISLASNSKMFTKNQLCSQQEESIHALLLMELIPSSKEDITLSRGSVLLGGCLKSCLSHWFQKGVILEERKENEMQKLPFLDF